MISGTKALGRILTPPDEEIVVSLPFYDDPWAYTKNYPLKAVGAHLVGPFFLAYKVTVFASKLLYDFCILLPNSFLGNDYRIFYLKTKNDLVRFASFFIKMIPLIGPYFGFFYDSWTGLLNNTSSPVNSLSSISSQEIDVGDLEDVDRVPLDVELENVYQYMVEIGGSNYAFRAIKDLRKKLGEYESQLGRSIMTICKHLTCFIQKNVAFFKEHPLLVQKVSDKEQKVSDKDLISVIERKLNVINKMRRPFKLAEFKWLMEAQLSLLKKGLTYLEVQLGDTDLKTDIEPVIARIRSSHKHNLQDVLDIYEMQMKIETRHALYIGADTDLEVQLGDTDLKTDIEPVIARIRSSHKHNLQDVLDIYEMQMKIETRHALCIGADTDFDFETDSDFNTDSEVE